MPKAAKATLIGSPCANPNPTAPPKSAGNIAGGGADPEPAGFQPLDKKGDGQGLPAQLGGQVGNDSGDAGFHGCGPQPGFIFAVGLALGTLCGGGGQRVASGISPCHHSVYYSDYYCDWGIFGASENPAGDLFQFFPVWFMGAFLHKGVFFVPEKIEKGFFEPFFVHFAHI